MTHLIFNITRYKVGITVARFGIIAKKTVPQTYSLAEN